MFENRKQLRRMILVVAAAAAVSSPAHASVQGKLVKEAIEYFAKKFGKELVEEGTEQTAKRLGQIAAKYGDDAVAVLRPLGPRGVKFADEFGETGYRMLQKHGREGLVTLEKYGDEAIQLAKTHGDEALDVLVNQPGVGRQLVVSYPKEMLPTIAGLRSDEAVRLSKIAPDFAKLPPAAQKTFAEKLAQGGDDFVMWAYKRRKEIFVSGASAAALISLYKLGDGVATNVSDLIPAAPNPETSPGLWMFLVGVVGLAFTSIILGIAWMWRPRRRTVKASA
jgi:hypothetical protein